MGCGSRIGALLASALGLSPCVAYASAPETATAAASAFHVLSTGIEWQHGPVVMRITVLRDDVVRVRIGRNGALPEDASWAALPAARRASVAVTGFSTADAAGFSTGAMKVSVARRDGGVTVTDRTGRVLLSDLDGAVLPDRRGAGFTITKAIPDDAHYFGLGDKFGPLDRLGRSFVMWNTDSYGYQEGQDPLYKDIPFFIGYTKGGYYGVFLDNSWRTSFDFGKARRGELTIGADGGPVDYYVLAGPDPGDVERAYAWLTGTPAMQPLWALGFQQSRWGYPTERDVRSVVARYRHDRIPLDAIWLDIDYQQHFRPFTVDPGTFPTFGRMVADFTAQRVHTVAITDLHIADLPNAGYAPYDSGMAQDRFVKTGAGQPYVAPVWPGPTLFPDFTQAATRAWWGTLYRQFYLEDGIAGFWNDMDEPAIFETPTKTMPLDNRHRIDEPGFASRVAFHREIHNLYGMQNHRATYEGLLALKPDERPFVMTRATYAGGQRYGVTWTGDNSSTWNHLRLTIPMLESLGLGGFTFSGADIGGFAGSASADLLTRWIEVATFTPIARDHSDEQSLPQEPWIGGRRHEDIRRRFIEARYRLLPYLYTVAEEAARTGLPMMRPLFLEFPEGLLDGTPLDLATGSQFMLGRALMVAAPPTPESPGPYSVILPAGGWYEYWTGRPVGGLRPLSLWGAGGLFITLKDTGPAAPHMVSITPRLDQLPVYVRAGSIIPRQPLVQSTGETPRGPLEIDVYPGANCQGSVYADDGHSFAFRQGVYSRVALSCTVEADHGVAVTIGRPEGSFQPWWRSYRVVVHGFDHAPHGIGGNGGNGTRPIPVAYDGAAGSAQFTVSADGAANTYRLRP
ncbi:glycoside hydrolase family 31 protein [Gluconacetobacter tumulisoli]|uniref:Glycoside hydrolase family 31 protein n=2 Tax=Gluconacetobacter tumulisoli TaxID=1286189 RepID=A0A7W4K5J3_9PROT|nr:glycoside hydrolase family 31 protein [Gluconacetobacter tumulisoli]